MSDGRDRGAITSAIEALFLLANDAWFSGMWDETWSFTGSALIHDYRLVSWPGKFIQGLLAAARGETDRSLRIAHEMTNWAGPREAQTVMLPTKRPVIGVHPPSNP